MLTYCLQNFNASALTHEHAFHDLGNQDVAIWKGWVALKFSLRHKTNVCGTEKDMNLWLITHWPKETIIRVDPIVFI